MFKATKPFKDNITNYPKEPSLRIGRCVPENAVNLAYYYNPTATDAEKVLTAEAPRNTIDHRVEEAYRYLFNQSSDDDNLFPGSVWYEDQEGYQGRLGRMYVNWYPEAHILVKNVQITKDIIIVDKSELPKMFEYSDANGYSGNLYLDAASYEVTKTKDESSTEVLDREVFVHELNYHEIFGTYINPKELDSWMRSPTGVSSTMWPSTIVVDFNKLAASGGNAKVQNYINAMGNPYDEATGVLSFDKLEYEQVYAGAAVDGKVTEYTISSQFVSETFEYTGTDEEDVDSANKYVAECEVVARKYFKSSYHAHYNSQTDTYDYTEINTFITMAKQYCSSSSAQFYQKLQEAMSSNKDIAVYMDRLDMDVDSPSTIATSFKFLAKYKYKVSDRGAEGTYQYNVVANYKGMLKKNVVRIKEVPAEYKATCNFVGLARKVWYDYDGVAYYRGAVTKGNGIGNVNPEGDNELLMFSDDNGYLRRPVESVGEDGTIELKNFYEVESEYIYLTDVFKDGVACFYKYPLKLPIYDYRGPDDNGFYEGNAVKMFTSGLKDLPEGYKHSMKLKVAEYETVSDITEDYQLVYKEVPKRYTAELFTSFISSSSDTFKVVYNAFNDSEVDNVALDNGVTESVYNYPFMIDGVDFTLEQIDEHARINKIKLPEPKRIKDTRKYITFTYTITAERKSDDKKFTTSPRTVSILNRDYVVPAEYSKFDGRAMIISPKIDGILMSPFDLVLYDQAASRSETVVTSKDTDFVFYATITEIASEDVGGVNIKCNSDGSGYITAETTIETGFWDEDLGAYTKKLCLESPYYIENGYIYPGLKVKCVDTRHIKIQAPREEGLLQSWYPRIQFGHYSQVLDQYGAHIKVYYTMPEYDEQHYSDKYKRPHVDVFEEKVTILNSHMVQTQCYPLFIKENETTISLFKKLDDELFEIHISDISFSDGIIITEETISENDNIICNYTYVEESYIYRGYWRNQNDFARIDLNPNKYHTYSDLNYIPSETKPTKNLFNKVIYFFMRPSLEVNGVDVVDKEIVIDSTDENLLAKVFEESNLLMFQPNDESVTAFSEEEKLTKWASVDGTIKSITNDPYLYMFKTASEYDTYDHTVTLKSDEFDDDALVIFIGVVQDGDTYRTLSLVCALNTQQSLIRLGNEQFALVYDYYKSSQVLLKSDPTFTPSGKYWSEVPNGITVKIEKTDTEINIYRTELNEAVNGEFNTSSKTPVISITLDEIKNITNKDFTKAAIGYGNVSQKNATFSEIKVSTVSTTNKTTHIEWDYENPILRNSETLYHQIDNAQPESDHDIYIGSVYIRQNTSLHSTILVDSRTRGGGVIESMKDSLRKELEPESDYYLDIGYYDGEPYQENGVIIVRLDNSLLKEFGGRFTQGDIEFKVKRWLGFGVYPIIEYVDSYSKKDMPQYNLTIEDSYTNVINETPEILLECVEVS